MKKESVLTSVAHTSLRVRRSLCLDSARGEGGGRYAQRDGTRELTVQCTGSNTYVLGRGPKRILLDTAQGEKEWAKNLKDVLEREKATVQTCLLSHWHHDHVGGVKDLEGLVPVVQVWKNTPELNPDGILDVQRVKAFEDGQVFAAEDGEFEVKAVHCPGHTKDHMAFVVTRSEDQDEVGAMFTGDNVLGHGTAVFEDLAAYLKSLAVMGEAVGEGSKAYPGHGAVIEDARAKIQEYVNHRKMREEEALNVLRFGATKKPEEGIDGVERVEGKEWGSMEMVKVIYSKYPENLWAPAEHGLLMVLKKLKGEGKVVRTETGWRVGEKAIL